MYSSCSNYLSTSLHFELCMRHVLVLQSRSIYYSWLVLPMNLRHLFTSVVHPEIHPNSKTLVSHRLSRSSPNQIGEMAKNPAGNVECWLLCQIGQSISWKAAATATAVKLNPSAKVQSTKEPFIEWRFETQKKLRSLNKFLVVSFWNSRNQSFLWPGILSFSYKLLC